MNLLAFQAAMTPQIEQRIRLWMRTRLTITQQCDLAKNFPERMRVAYNKRLTSQGIVNHLNTLTPKQSAPDELMPDLLRLYFLYNERYARSEVGSSLPLIINSYLARLTEFLNPLELTLIAHGEVAPGTKLR